MREFAITEEARRFVHADSPERAKEALLALLEAIEDNLSDSANEVETAWQELAPGKPWRKLRMAVARAGMSIALRG